MKVFYHVKYEEKVRSWDVWYKRIFTSLFFCWRIMKFGRHVSTQYIYNVNNIMQHTKYSWKIMWLYKQQDVEDYNVILKCKHSICEKCLIAYIYQYWNILITQIHCAKRYFLDKNIIYIMTILNKNKFMAFANAERHDK